MARMRAAGGVRRRLSPTWRRWSLRVPALAACVLAVGVVSRGQGPAPVQVDMESGGAWVASNVGLMTLIDGETAEVVARVDVGGASSALAASQTGSTGYAVDGQAGTVVRVDPRTFAATPPIEVVPGAAGHMAAHAAERAVYVLDQDRGRVVVADPHDLAVREGGGASVADEVRSSVVDRRGRLWLLGATTGNLVAFDGRAAPRRVEHAVRHPDQAELVVADGETVVVDRAAQRVRQVDGAGHVRHSACIDASTRDDTLHFGGAERDALVFSVSGRQGVLRVSDLHDGGCSDVAIPVAAPGSDLGDPVEHSGRVFVPNFSTGRVEVVDVERGSASSTDEQVADGQFQLFVVDGFVFFNDPDSERAGVIHLDGSVADVAKYDPTNPRSALDNDRLAGAARPEAAPAPPPGPGDDQATTPPPPDAGGDPGAEAQPPPGAPGAVAPPPPGGGDQRQAPAPPGQPGSPPGPARAEPVRPEHVQHEHADLDLDHLDLDDDQTTTTSITTTPTAELRHGRRRRRRHARRVRPRRRQRRRARRVRRVPGLQRQQRLRRGRPAQRL